MPTSTKETPPVTTAGLNMDQTGSARSEESGVWSLEWPQAGEAFVAVAWFLLLNWHTVVLWTQSWTLCLCVSCLYEWCICHFFCLYLWNLSAHLEKSSTQHSQGDEDATTEWSPHYAYSWSSKTLASLPLADLHCVRFEEYVWVLCSSIIGLEEITAWTRTHLTTWLWLQVALN